MPTPTPKSIDRELQKQPKPGQITKESRPGNEVSKISLKQKIIEIVTLLFSGILYACAFPGLDWSFLSWVGIIPLLFIASEKHPGRAWRCGFFWGLGWAITSFFWIREIELILPIPLGIYLAFYPAFWAWLIPFLKKQFFIPNDIQLNGFHAVESYEKKKSFFRDLAYATTLASWWCFLEWIRSWLFTGLPWNNLATTQWQNLSVIQITEYTGIYGVSFLIIFTNIAIYLSYSNFRVSLKSGKYHRPALFFTAMLLLTLNSFWGTKKINSSNSDEFKIPFTLAALQGDIPQSRAATYEQVVYSLSQYSRLSYDVMIKAQHEKNTIIEDLKKTQRASNFRESALLKGKPDLVVWPETAVPIPFTLDHVLGERYRKNIKNFTTKYQTKFLIGTLDYGNKNDAEVSYNSAYLIDENAQVIQKYHKKHIVPFGEFVPFADYFPWLVDMIGMGRGLSRGQSSEPLDLGRGVKAGTNICFEDVFPYITRDQVRSGANMLLTITNDAWYPKSDEPQQHLANSIFRAIETRRPFVRCGNNSGSCVINVFGEITDTIFNSSQNNTKERITDPAHIGSGNAIFVIKVPKNPGFTFYTKYGNIFILLCFLVLFTALTKSIWKWFEKKQILIQKLK